MYWMPTPPSQSPPAVETPPTKKAPENLPKMLTQECPHCKVRGAYIGYSYRVECINPGCSCFTQRWADDYKKMVVEHEAKEKKTIVDAKTLLSEEFGLDWNENEVTTEDMILRLVP